MTRFATRLQSTLRDMRQFALPLGLWVLITATAAITGPFQTFDLLSPVPRTLYWGFVVALSIVLSLGQLWLFRNQRAVWRLLGWLPYSVVFAGLLQALNLAVFPHWQGWPDYLWLLGVVLAICLLAELADVILFPARAEEPVAKEPPGDPTAPLMARLAPDRRGRLIRIEAKDHYLSIVTSNGASLILMRMADAEALLAGADGLRVHRSHWVMTPEVMQHKRMDGRDLLVMSDGSEVPVSRSARETVERAGLIRARARA